VSVTLIGVALVAGLATFLSPCVLPVLPVVVAAGATGGRRRPLGVAVGLAAFFALFTLAASRVLSALGLPQDLLHDLAVVLLALAGVALLVPALGELAGRAFQPVARLASRRLTTGDGFASGVGLGAALALVWTPCAGPILAAVTALAAERRVSGTLVVLAIAYAVGATLPLFALALAGQRAAAPFLRVRERSRVLRRAAGVVLLAGAWLFTTNLPTRLAAATPGYLSSLQSAERSGAVRDDLRALQPTDRAAPSAASAGRSPDTLKDYGKAPEFAKVTAWLNTPGGNPVSLRQLRGKVVLVDFWTYSCVNCIRTLPYLKAWNARYAPAGLVIVGVHTPEFAFEHVVGNVRQAIREHGIRYPVAVDDDYGTWEAWGNQYWPADYLVDRRGRVRDAHFGEGAYDETESALRTLLGESAGAAMARPGPAITASPTVRTPETYLGSERGDAYHQELHPAKPYRYTAPDVLAPNGVALDGQWTVEGQRIVAGGGAKLAMRYAAPRIYLVAAPPPGATRSIGAAVDGKALAPVKVVHDDLYQVAHLPTAGPHLLELHVPPGTSLYSFTFG
jgi:cytochrome c biogenesis protein CcdA/thiol-disulfide isomerase/thioredoxin